MELEVAVRVDHRVAGVVAAAVADDQVGIVGQVVDDPALALVAPLGADDGDDGHGAAAATSGCGNAAIVPPRRPARGESGARKSAASSAALARVLRRGVTGQARARTLSKQLLQYTGRSLRGRNGTSAWPPHSAQTAACISRCPPLPPPLADAQRSILLGDGAAALAALGLVHQPLAGVELLLAGGEHEVHPAVATADGLVGVHPFQCLLSRTPGPLDARGLR